MRKSVVWLLAAPAVMFLGASITPPTVTSGQVLVSSLDVTKPPAAPKVMLHVKGGPSYFSFSWTGPSGEGFTQSFRPTVSTNTPVFQANDPIFPESTGSQNTFGLYTEPGTWKLTSLFLCSPSNCVTYNSTQLTQLFSSVAIQITNPNPPDFTAPVAHSAKIQTTKVSISAGGSFAIDLGASDDLSGVFQVEVDAGPTSAPNSATSYAVVDSSTHLSGVIHLMGTLYAGSPTGTYIISRVFLRDVAGNATYVTDPAAISKLFHGATSFEVTS